MEYIKISPTVHLLVDPAERKKTSLEFIYSNGGSWFEKGGDRGRKHLLEHCIASRSKKLNFKKFKEYNFKENISTNAYTSAVSLGVTASGYHKDFNKIFDLLFEIFTEPTFDEEGLCREKEIVLREISDRSGDPNYRKYYDSVKKVFTPDSFDVHEILGDREAVAATNLEDFERLHKQNLEDSHLFFCASGGGIDSEYMKKKIESFVGGLSKEAGLVKDEKVKKSLVFDARTRFLDFQRIGIFHPLAHEHAELSVYIPCEISFENKAIREVFSNLFLRYGGDGLYDRLRDDLGLIYGYYFGYDKYAQTIQIDMNCELSDVLKIVSEIEKFFSDFDSKFSLKKFKELRRLTKKKQEIAMDKLGGGVKMTVGGLIGYGFPESYEDFGKRVDSVTPEDIKNLYQSVQEGVENMKVSVVSNNRKIENIF